MKYLHEAPALCVRDVSNDDARVVHQPSEQTVRAAREAVLTAMSSLRT